MSLLIQYLVKLSISLSIVWLFYQFVLRRLTFYNSNRWYLLGYTLLSFFIPFINISLLFDDGSSNELVHIIPSVHQYTIALEEASHCPIPIWSTPYDKWDFLGFTLMIGAVIFLLRFAKSFISFLRIRNKAALISAGEINIYQVNNEIIPFSFGNSVFINHSQHTAEELEEIVRHEFVHVKQKHTIDILWAEFLCILNWYNPFAWLLKKSIRQNLEFIADNKVIENGINKKEYQYLLLKVIGNNQFSIATQFNFSSLKKRIVMMNKTKSAKRQLGRFLFLVPVLAIILLSFRHSFQQVSTQRTPGKPVIADTIPDVTIVNSKGYYIDIKDDKGNCTVVVKDNNKKEVKRILLTEWNAKADYYENLYGEILSPKIEAGAERSKAIREAILAKNPDITNFEVKGNTATVTLKNGKTETYTLSIKDQKKALEERCGLEEIAITTTIAEEVRIVESPVEVTVAKEANFVTETVADNFEITDTKAVMHMRNGKTEEYDLTNEKERQAFEKRFGKIIKLGTTTPGVYSVVSVAEPTELPLSTTVSLIPTKEAVAVISTEDEFVVGEAEVLLTITKKTTREELESFKSKLKTKGFDLSYDKVEYENGNLKKISGSVKSKDITGKFSGTDFSKVVVSIVRQGENEYFRVNVAENKKVVS